LSGRGLCDELITRPEESYRLCCVVVCDLETSRMGAPYIYDIRRLRVNITYRVGYVTTKDATTKECYNEQFLSIKAICYNEQRCYNESGGILTGDVARACA